MEKMCCYQSGVGLGGVLFTLELWKARGVPLSFGSCGIALKGWKIVVKPGKGKNSHLRPANEK